MSVLDSKYDFSAMVESYREWNEKINVISRKDTDNIYEHHILHSLSIALYLEECRPDELEQWKQGGVKVLDAGCGGGFPGIPLAAVFPNVQFTLCDSIGKKIKVATEVSKALGLENVSCVNARVEQLPGCWDYVVSRAVTSLDNLLPWVQGRFTKSLICLKGGDIVAEIAECAKKQGKRMPTVDVWKIENILKDEYFKEKVVVNLVNCQK